jgi:single-stranded DNA-binding protein
MTTTYENSEPNSKVRFEADINHVRLIGTVAASDGLKFAASGQPLIRARVRTETDKRTSLHDVVIPGDLAVRHEHGLCLGARVRVEGRLSCRFAERVRGVPTFVTEIVAESVEVAE